MNNTVTATGMQVKASTSKNLLINTSNSTSGGEASKASTLAGQVTLTPASASVAALKADHFYSANSDVVYDTGAAKVGTVFTEQNAISSGSTGYAVKHTFYVYVDGTSTDTMTNLYVSNISVVDTDATAAADAEISKALRIGVVCGSNAFIYSVTGGQTSYQGLKAAGEVATITENVLKTSAPADLSEATTAYDTFASSNILAATVASTAATQVDIYIWYEGQDTACTTANSVTIENLRIDVAFTATGS